MLARALLSVTLMACAAYAFVAPTPSFAPSARILGSASSRSMALRGGALASKMIDITPNVSFDTIAREWRCKWSADADKASLVAAQNALTEVLSTIKGTKGVKGVQRVVCGGCLDFKVVVSLTADAFGEWEKTKFAPEEAFLGKLKAIKGISQVETQTYTIMPM